MATASNEIVESRTMEIRNGSMRGEREWRVWDSAGVPLTPNDALSDAGLPVQGDEFPGVPGLIRHELITSERIPKNPNMCKVVWDYVGAATDVNFDLTVEYHAERTAELTPTYRIPSTSTPLEFPSAAEQLGFSNKNVTDIEGESNDIRGVRQTFVRHKMLLTVSEIIPTVRGGGIIGITHLRGRRGYSFLDSFIGTRNRNTFFDFVRGQVLYTGVTSHRLRLNELSLTHHFVADEWFHMVQVALTDQDGKPFIKIIPSGPLNTPVAFPVFWRQPFNLFSNFNLISAHF